jgi:hypothetical protein
VFQIVYSPVRCSELMVANATVGRLHTVSTRKTVPKAGKIVSLCRILTHFRLDAFILHFLGVRQQCALLHALSVCGGAETTASRENHMNLRYLRHSK